MHLPRLAIAFDVVRMPTHPLDNDVRQLIARRRSRGRLRLDSGCIVCRRHMASYVVQYNVGHPRVGDNLLGSNVQRFSNPFRRAQLVSYGSDLPNIGTVRDSEAGRFESRHGQCR
jgi:hypothetical protein